MSRLLTIPLSRSQWEGIDKAKAVALHRAQDEALRLQGLERPRSQYITTLESRCAALESDLERSQAVRLDLYKDNQRMTLAIANLRREALQGKRHRRADRQARRKSKGATIQPAAVDNLVKLVQLQDRDSVPPHSSYERF